MRIVAYLSILAALSEGPFITAQTNTPITLQLYAGLTISGTVGSNYLVQCTTNLVPPTNWLTVGTVTLPSSHYLWLDTTTAAAGERFYQVVSAPVVSQPIVPSGTILVPSGSFVMGDSIDGESDAPSGNVTLSAFYMDTNLVSYALWEQVCQWASSNGYAFDGGETALGSNYPVQSVSWYDAVKWCNARSQKAGLPPVYYADTNLTQIYLTGDVAPYVNWTTNGYRLPTEAEWEKAARGGLSGQRFPWGNSIAESQANYYGDPFNALYGFGYTYDLGPAGNNATWYVNTGFSTLGNTSTVGFYAGNGYNINDMAGNVFEWCWDWYGAYGSFPMTNPHGAAPGAYRVVRGGGWNHQASDCRSACRGSEAPDFADNEHGFRCVLPQNP